VTPWAWVSTEDQNLDGQCQRLSAAGCEKLFEEKLSGANRNRPKLEKLIEQLRKGDVLVVTRLDRLARSTSELLRIAERLTEKSAGLQSLDEPWADTTSPSGRMVMTVFAGIAEFERTLIISRTNDGRMAAKARGVTFGRPKKMRRPAGAGPGTRQGRQIDQRCRQDLQRPSGDDLPRHRGIGAYATFLFLSAAQAYHGGAIADADAGRVSAQIEEARLRIRPKDTVAVRAPFVPRLASVYPPRRRRCVSPDRLASRDRRRRLAYSGPLPQALACQFTVGQLAVLRVVADEVRLRGLCVLPLGAIAARADDDGDLGICAGWCHRGAASPD
jgi:DNA invertase Pin-like site-specific DNA recombinase